MITDWNEIAERQYQWVEKMGWHNKTTLEAICLICSEIGEAAAESLNNKISPHLGEELADIVLRTVDLAKVEGVDINFLVSKTERVEWKSSSLLEHHAEMLIDTAKWINSARKLPLEEDFGHGVAKLLLRVQSLSSICNIDLARSINDKIELNRLRGTRGRRI